MYANSQKIFYDIQSEEKQNLLLQPKGLIAVVGVKSEPLNKLDEIINEAIFEANLLYRYGCRNIMIQNVKDVPFNDSGKCETIASMSIICKAVRNAIPEDCFIGLSMLKDNGEALVTVATAAKLDYIRPKCYVGAVVNHDGIHQGIINEVLNQKKKLQSNLAIFSDILDRTSTPLGNFTLEELVGQAISFGQVDAINLAGKDLSESIALADRIRIKFPGLYIYLAGGCNIDNLEEAYKHFDGIYVASCLKDTGNMTGSLSEEKVRCFMNKYLQL